MGVTLLAIVEIVGGLTLLVAGGEVLVRGASRLASAMRISPLVIGLTVVAFGTSSPELAVAIQSALIDKTDLAIGNGAIRFWASLEEVYGETHQRRCRMHNSINVLNYLPKPV